jgi:polyhydroxyalkanoate synthase
MLAPRPLPLHLSLAALTTLFLPNALPSLNNGLQRSKNASPVSNLEHLSAIAFATAQWGKFQAGVAKLAAMPTPIQSSPLGNVAANWNGTILYDAGAPPGKILYRLLLIPSLINKPRIFTLKEQENIVSFLREAGIHCYILDWGIPDEKERSFDCKDFLEQRLLPAIDHLRSLPDTAPLCLLGYCMGGLFAAAAAKQREGSIAALILLATPWDFHAAAPAGIRVWLAGLRPTWENILRQPGIMPVDGIQALLLSLDPFGTVNRYIAFADQNDKDENQQFQRVEHWLADGVPLPYGVLREALFSWYLENTPYTEGWHGITPKNLSLPVLVVAPQRDGVVPSAAALAFQSQNQTILSPVTGHLGMVAGRHSTERVFIPLLQWLNKL